MLAIECRHVSLDDRLANQNAEGIYCISAQLQPDSHLYLSTSTPRPLSRASINVCLRSSSVSIIALIAASFLPRYRGAASATASSTDATWAPKIQAREPGPTAYQAHAAAVTAGFTTRGDAPGIEPHPFIAESTQRSQHTTSSPALPGEPLLPMHAAKGTGPRACDHAAYY